ncbi:MAG: cytochrome C oxidase subunit IV family protein [Methylotenera sp.]|nr:cytochrome C oxidase subunit IV family protein [Methylotenera sp.]
MQNTQSQTNRFSSIIWLLLIVLTMATFNIGESGLPGKETIFMLLAITMIKSQIVANYFMGLRHVKFFWRGIMFGYFLIVGGLIAIAYLIG